MFLIDLKRLERLRREQDSRRYRETEQPTLQLPVPEPNQRPTPPPEDDPEQEHGVVVIEM